MKVIISHDVDHLYGKEHWFRDLVYPKMWVRESIQLLSGKSTLREWWLRCTSAFKNKRNCISEVMQFDKRHNVPSTFFFGMKAGLGMSYKPEEAKSMINFVKENGFGVGVHGNCYDSSEKIALEKETFRNLMGYEPDGIRIHYVRFNENTFSYLNEAGYIFDSTEFDKKEKGTIKNPYKVGEMWEFPLTIMDAYISRNIESAKEETLQRLKSSEEQGLKYVTILFHDLQYSEAYTDMYRWYEWLIMYLESSKDYEFVSYTNAINELEVNA